MEDNKKFSLVSVAAVVGVVAVAAVALFSVTRPSISVNVAGGNTPPITVGASEAPSGEQKFGTATADNTTNWIAGSFSDDLSVGGNLTVAGTSTFSGNVSGVPKSLSITMTSGTTTPCAVQNTSGVARVLTSVAVVEDAYAGAGTVGLNVGTSTDSGTTSTSALINNAAFANSSAKIVISTTSTLQTAYAPWLTGEWMVFKTTTSTNSGTCKVTYLP